MKFVFVTAMPGFSWGGSEELWSQGALKLHKDGHTVAASVPFWPTISPRVTEMVDKGIGVYIRRPIPENVIVRSWTKAARMLGNEAGKFRWLRLQKPDLVIISQGGIADGMEWMKFCMDADLPFVVICQCNTEFWWPTDEVAITLAEAYLTAKKVFCVSQSNLKLLEQQIGGKLPNAVIIRNPFNVSPDKLIQWPIETDTWRMACVARLDPVAKGQDLLFQVLAQPRWRERAVQINLYGAGPFAQGLKRLAEYLQLKTVHFHGHVNDVAAIWAHNHMLVLPSRWEGLPLALVEAMWCSRPALVTNIAGNSELCVDGETGFVAEAPTARILAQTMETAWERCSDWHTMGLAARLRVEQIIPRDPAGDFARQLVACAGNESVP